MPFALVIIGLLMVVTGARDTHVQFAEQLKTDFTGPPSQNFLWWLAALGLIGSLGYVKPLAPFSKAFLVLVIIVMILAQSKNGGGGFFGQLQNALQSGPVAPTPTQTGTGSATTSTPQVAVTGTPSNIQDQAKAAGGWLNWFKSGATLNALSKFLPLGL